MIQKLESRFQKKEVITHIIDFMLKFLKKTLVDTTDRQTKDFKCI